MRKLITFLQNHLRKYFVSGQFKKENEDIIEQQFIMPVPSETIFGVDDETFKSITYGEVRLISDENKLIRLLKSRLDTFLFNQTEPIKTPFPLVVMACVSIETIGQIFYSENKNDSSHRFVSVINRFSNQFSRNFDSEFKKRLANLWSENSEISKIKTLGLLIYTYLRNTMIHGFQGRGVFLSIEDTTCFEKKEGYLVINPNWFWQKSKDVFYDLYLTALKGQSNSPERKNCLKYINKLLR